MPALKALDGISPFADERLGAAIRKAVTPERLGSLAGLLRTIDFGADARVILSGDLSCISIAEVLQMLELQRQTGALSIASQTAEITLYVRDGMLDLAQGRGMPTSFRLGRYLLSLGALSRAELAHFLENRAGSKRLIGDALVQLDMVEDAEVREALKLQTSELVYEVVGWRSGRFTFARDVTCPEATLTPGVSPRGRVAAHRGKLRLRRHAAERPPGDRASLGVERAYRDRAGRARHDRRAAHGETDRRSGAGQHVRRMQDSVPVPELAPRPETRSMRAAGALAVRRSEDDSSEHRPMLVSRLLPSDREAVESVALATSAAIEVDAELLRPCALFWVARSQPAEAALAFLLAWAVADELHLIHIATHPGSRRRGAARALVGALVEHATESKSRLVLLEVRRSNRPAIRLYRGFGFTAMGVRRSYYSDGEDAIEMRLTLDPMTGHITPGRDEVALAEA